jgi:CxxC motif-containing protein (DUF1111 family)
MTTLKLISENIVGKIFSLWFYSLSMAGLVLAFGCSNEVEDIYTSGGRLADPKELSAGASTIFTASSKAFDTPADWVTGELAARFLAGDALYDNPRVSSGNPVNGGLGPLYVGYSCASCHNNAGRTIPTLHTNGGSGAYGFSSFLTFIRSKNDQYFKNYGRVLHDQAIYGYQPEGKLHVSYTEKTYQFDDGEEYALITPKYWITDWYADSIPAGDLEMSVRIPLRHVGLGLMNGLDVTELQKLAATGFPEYGISGEINYVTEKNKTYIGFSGHKAQHADLTVELGFSSDMGVTNSRFPEEVSQGQEQDPHGDALEISDEDMASVDFYINSLGVPARRNVNNELVQKGEEAFYEAKCQLCHMPTLHTRQDAPLLLDGTRLPWLSGQTIHPYTDFLIHDMGPELGDDYAQFNASGDEWRTTPLWGVGLQETVSGHTYFLHDGRARNFVEAIMWHGGEGDVSRQIFKKMSKQERDALVMFLKSL